MNAKLEQAREIVAKLEKDHTYLLIAIRKHSRAWGRRRLVNRWKADAEAIWLQATMIREQFGLKRI